MGAMNTLRPFLPHEVNRMGGAGAFFPPAWSSTTLAGDDTVWSLPWTTYTYLILFRRDRLERAGVDAAAAFKTPAAMAETLARLQSLGMEFPWIIPGEAYYADLIHIAASFIWGANGHFISPDGKHILVHQPASLAGLADFFELYRYLPTKIKDLTYSQCTQLFAEGRVGVFIAGAEAPGAILASPDTAPAVRSYLQVTLPPGIPWVGGDNLVIWRHVRGDPQQEQAALSLVNYLLDPETQLAYSQAQNVLPAKASVLAQLPMEPASLKPAVEAALSQGRAHSSTALWRVVEFRINQALNEIAAEMLENRAADLNKLFEKHLIPVAQRLELTLEQ